MRTFIITKTLTHEDYYLGDGGEEKCSIDYYAPKEEAQYLGDLEIKLGAKNGGIRGEVENHKIYVVCGVDAKDAIRYVMDKWYECSEKNGNLEFFLKQLDRTNSCIAEDTETYELFHRLDYADPIIIDCKRSSEWLSDHELRVEVSQHYCGHSWDIDREPTYKDYILHADEVLKK